MKQYRIHPAADRELFEAFNYYEDQVEGLGYDFMAEVEESVRFLLAYPDAAPQVAPGVRSRVLSRFPYSIIYYRVGKERLEILAVPHQSRRPFYWIGRLR